MAKTVPRAFPSASTLTRNFLALLLGNRVQSAIQRNRTEEIAVLLQPGLLSGNQYSRDALTVVENLFFPV